MTETNPPMPPDLYSALMAAEIPSSDSGAQIELVRGKRPPMPDELFSALMTDKEKDILQYLGLSEKEHVTLQVGKMEDGVVQVQQTETYNQTNIQSETQFGETVLHLLVRNGQDELALKLFKNQTFQKELQSMLKARNNNLETPLHIAARIENEKISRELIDSFPEIVKDALAESDNNGDTALHIAARYDNTTFGRRLMKLDPEVARKVNNKGLSPLHVAIDNECTSMVRCMLEELPNLACIPNHYGSFPIHLAAAMGNIHLVKHIMEFYPNHVNYLDHQGCNLFHIAANMNQADLFELSQYFRDQDKIKVKQMNEATDYEGNTPLHIAAEKGHRLIIRVICKNNLNCFSEQIRNRQGFTPLQLSAKQVMNCSEINDIKDRIRKYITKNNYRFTTRWFEDIMAPSDNSKWERTQVIGLGAVLITTVTFAAAFTIPGGYNQNDGTPILGRTIAYKAFTVANTISFVLAFTSLYTLVSIALVDPDYAHLKNATDTFTASAGFMVIAFALGSYVMLEPVSLPIAITVLVVAMPLGSPFMSLVVKFYRSLYKYIHLLLQLVQLLLLAVWVGMGA